VKPANGAVGAPVLGLTNLDGAPSNTRMVFNRIQNPNPVNPPGFVDAIHDTGTLRLNNTGDQPLVITALTLSDTANWTISSPPALPATIAPGEALDINVHFIATTNPSHADNQTNNTVTVNGIPVVSAGGVWNGTLTISANDPLHPSRVVQLAGYWQNTSENENEPGLQTLVNLVYGYGTNIRHARSAPVPQQRNHPGQLWRGSHLRALERRRHDPARQRPSTRHLPQPI